VKNFFFTIIRVSFVLSLVVSRSFCSFNNSLSFSNQSCSAKKVAPNLLSSDRQLLDTKKKWEFCKDKDAAVRKISPPVHSCRVLDQDLNEVNDETAELIETWYKVHRSLDAVCTYCAEYKDCSRQELEAVCSAGYDGVMPTRALIEGTDFASSEIAGSGAGSSDSLSPPGASFLSGGGGRSSIGYLLHHKKVSLSLVGLFEYDSCAKEVVCSLAGKKDFVDFRSTFLSRVGKGSMDRGEKSVDNFFSCAMGKNRSLPWPFNVVGHRDYAIVLDDFLSLDDDHLRCLFLKYGARKNMSEGTFLTCLGVCYHELFIALYHNFHLDKKNMDLSARGSGRWHADPLDDCSVGLLHRCINRSRLWISTGVSSSRMAVLNSDLGHAVKGSQRGGVCNVAPLRGYGEFGHDAVRGEIMDGRPLISIKSSKRGGGDNPPVTQTKHSGSGSKPAVTRTKHSGSGSKPAVTQTRHSGSVGTTPVTQTRHSGSGSKPAVTPKNTGDASKEENIAVFDSSGRVVRVPLSTILNVSRQYLPTEGQRGGKRRTDDDGASSIKNRSVLNLNPDWSASEDESENEDEDEYGGE
jgi:hypothetical protein